MRHTIVNIMENQWKLRQQHGQSFPMKGASEEIKKFRKIHSLGSKQES